MQRRLFLFSLGLSTILSPLAAIRNPSRADTKKPTQDDDRVELLYVQSAQGATLSGGTLKLAGVNPSTIFFSDRPARIVGHEPTEDFVADWTEGEDSFASNPPNAVLSILHGAEPQEIVLVLKNPRLEKSALLYDVDVLDGKKTASGEASSLFIDGVFRRVHRRRRRRRRRRIVRGPGPGPR